PFETERARPSTASTFLRDWSRRMTRSPAGDRPRIRMRAARSGSPRWTAVPAGVRPPPNPDVPSFHIAARWLCEFRQTRDATLAPAGIVETRGCIVPGQVPHRRPVPANPASPERLLPTAERQPWRGPRNFGPSRRAHAGYPAWPPRLPRNARRLRRAGPAPAARRRALPEHSGPPVRAQAPSAAPVLRYSCRRVQTGWRPGITTPGTDRPSASAGHRTARWHPGTGRPCIE